MGVTRSSSAGHSCAYRSARRSRHRPFVSFSSLSFFDAAAALGLCSPSDASASARSTSAEEVVAVPQQRRVQQPKQELHRGLVREVLQHAETAAVHVLAPLHPREEVQGPNGEPDALFFFGFGFGFGSAPASSASPTPASAPSSPSAIPPSASGAVASCVLSCFSCAVSRMRAITGVSSCCVGCANHETCPPACVKTLSYSCRFCRRRWRRGTRSSSTPGCRCTWRSADSRSARAHGSLPPSARPCRRRWGGPGTSR